MSKVVTLSADETTATVAVATIGDAFTTAFSMNSAVTGVMGLGQKFAFVAAGMAIQNNRLGRGFNFINVQ